jgi:hypothetical protein
LLHHVKGPTAFEDVRTVAGRILNITFTKGRILMTWKIIKIKNFGAPAKLQSAASRAARRSFGNLIFGGVECEAPRRVGAVRGRLARRGASRRTTPGGCDGAPGVLGALGPTASV